MSRLTARLLQMPFIVWQGLRRLHGRRVRPAAPRRILVVAQLLLGDALMLSGLLKALRLRHPEAHLLLAVPLPLVSLYAGRPWGVSAIGCSIRSAASVWRLIRSGPFDLALVAGDNRYGWLALAAGARYLVGHRTAAQEPVLGPFDELKPYPSSPVTITDLFMALADPGAEGEGETRGLAAPGTCAGLMHGETVRFAAGDWPDPPCSPFQRPDDAYLVFHVGASKAQKLWPAERWRQLADRVVAAGWSVVWSCGPGEGALLDAINPDGVQQRYAGTLDLAQMWWLLRDAAALLSPDTGIAHLARITGTPAVVLYGPASPDLVGPGRFWSRHAGRHLVADIACRDQQRLFKREVPWVRTCQRGDRECPWPACMSLLGVDAVFDALRALLEPGSRR